MLENDDYLVVTKANNGFMVSINNDEHEDNERVVDVFNHIDDLLCHIGAVLKDEKSMHTV